MSPPGGVDARAALRLILGDRLGVAPKRLRFVKGEHGKPAVEGQAVAFNLSHSGDLAVIAVADAGDLGVDVEDLGRSRNVDRLARRVLTGPERDRLDRATGPDDRARWFLRCWTAKEAVAKAFGAGLGIAPARMSVARAGESHGSVTVAPAAGGPLPAGAGPVAVRWAEPRPGFLVALAAEGDGAGEPVLRDLDLP